MKTSRTVVILEMLVCLVPFTWYFPLLLIASGSGLGSGPQILLSGLGLVAAWTIGLHFLARGRWPAGNMTWLWIGALAGLVGAVDLFIQGLAIVAPTILVAGHWGAAAWRQQQEVTLRRPPGRMLPVALFVWFLGWTGAALWIGLAGARRDDPPAVIAERTDDDPEIDLPKLGPSPRARPSVRLEPGRPTEESEAAETDSL